MADNLGGSCTAEAKVDPRSMIVLRVTKYPKEERPYSYPKCMAKVGHAVITATKEPMPATISALTSEITMVESETGANKEIRAPSFPREIMVGVAGIVEVTIRVREI